MNVSGAATLGGTLNVIVINGFASGTGATFQVVNFGSHTGQFTSIIPQNFPGGQTVAASYATSNLILTTGTAGTLVSIAVTPASPSVPVGLTEPFTAVGTYSDNSVANLTSQVTWASSNSSVASISNMSGTQGQALTVSQGTTVITAMLSSVLSPSDTLTVVAPALVSIAVTPASPSIAKGLTQPFTATGTFTDGTQSNITSSVTWASSAPAVGTINATGLVSSLAVGTTVITATQGNIISPTCDHALHGHPRHWVSIAVTVLLLCFISQPTKCRPKGLCNAAVHCHGYVL